MTEDDLLFSAWYLVLPCRLMEMVGVAQRLLWANTDLIWEQIPEPESHLWHQKGEGSQNISLREPFHVGTAGSASLFGCDDTSPAAIGCLQLLPPSMWKVTTGKYSWGLREMTVYKQQSEVFEGTPWIMCDAWMGVWARADLLQSREVFSGNTKIERAASHTHTEKVLRERCFRWLLSSC